MQALDRPQVNPDLPLQRGVDPVEKMLQQDVFRGDGGVGFQLEHPMAVRLLQANERCLGAFDGVTDLGVQRVQQGKTLFQAARRMLAAVRPDLIAPSIVAGNPVLVQSPARTRLGSFVRAAGRRRSCAAVAAKVARFSFTTR